MAVMRAAFALFVVVFAGTVPVHLSAFGGLARIQRGMPYRGVRKWVLECCRV